MDLNLKFQTGNVVEWDRRIYIVSKIHNDSLELIPIKGSNVTYHPSTRWPTQRLYHHSHHYDEECDGSCDHTDIPDPARTVDRVVKISKDVQSWITERLTQHIFNVGP